MDPEQARSVHAAANRLRASVEELRRLAELDDAEDTMIGDQTLTDVQEAAYLDMTEALVALTEVIDESDTIERSGDRPPMALPGPKFPEWSGGNVSVNVDRESLGELIRERRQARGPPDETPGQGGQAEDTGGRLGSTRPNGD